MDQIDEGMIKCQECEGTGWVYEEFAVVDYVNGGYLAARIIDCPNCDGLGMIEDWEDDDEDA